MTNWIFYKSVWYGGSQNSSTWQFSHHIWFAMGHILTSLCLKEAATYSNIFVLQPAVKVITIVNIWWKLMWKNATFTHNIKCYKSACIAYLGLLMIPEHTALMTLIKYCFTWNVFSSHNNFCLKQKVFLKETWGQNFTSFLWYIFVSFMGKGLIQIFAMFWPVFAKLWSYKGFFESDTIPTNTQHVSSLFFVHIFINFM